MNTLKLGRLKEEKNEAYKILKIRIFKLTKSTFAKT